jgi:predicted PurR-regulated permease PerM
LDCDTVWGWKDLVSSAYRDLVAGFVLSARVHALESGTNVWIILGLTGMAIVVVQIIQDTILAPKIMGKATGLNPAMMMLSLSISGKLLGLFRINFFY